MLAGYLGVEEIREQVPVHEEPGQHPGFDPLHRHPIEGSERTVPGLLDIAERAGVDPGRYPGTSLTFVMTTDLVLTVQDGECYKLVYWPVKPLSELQGGPACRRLQRLELERIRAMDVGGHFEVVTDMTVSEQFRANLSAYKPFPEDLEQWRGTDELARYAETFNACKGALLVDAWMQAGASIGSQALRESRRIFDVALWLGLLDTNLSHPMLAHRKIRWGGIAQRITLRQRLLGLKE